MTTKLTTRLIREGNFVAEVDVHLVEEEGGWSPYIFSGGRRQARCGQGLTGFANVHVDFANDSSWTPFVGAGAGMARTCLLYSRRLVRKPLAQGY